MDLEDSELIERFRQGDHAAFELLVRRYQRPLFTFLLRLCGDHETAQDLFQETFLKVLRGLPAYEEQGRFGSWLFGIAHRAATDAGRRKRTWLKRLVRSEQAVSAATDPRGSPESNVARTELAGQIETALAALPEKQRQVFLLRQHGAMSFKEIAARMDEPLNTVLSHMRYAVVKLRSALGPVIHPAEDTEGCEKEPSA